MGSKMPQPKNHSQVSGAAWDFLGSPGAQRAGGGTLPMLLGPHSLGWSAT